MPKIILIIGGILMIVFGIKRISTNSTPVVCSFEEVEKGDYSNYDYFKLSKGIIPGYCVYAYNERDTLKNISQIVYPVVSKKLLDSISVHTPDSGDLGKSLQSAVFRPKVYIK